MQLTKYPLCWPENQPRNRYPAWGNFGSPKIPESFDRLLNELNKTGLEEIIISSDIPRNKDGAIRANSTWTDHGVAAWFKRKGKLLCIACDKFDTPAKNMCAISLIVQGRRREERYGTDAMIESAWESMKYAELPTTYFDWRKELGVLHTDSLSKAEGNYRDLCKMHHPDLPTGSVERMQRLNQAIELARTELGQ